MSEWRPSVVRVLVTRRRLCHAAWRVGRHRDYCEEELPRGREHSLLESSNGRNCHRLYRAGFSPDLVRRWRVRRPTVTDGIDRGEPAVADGTAQRDAFAAPVG